MMNMMTGAVAINGGVGVMEIHQPQVAVSQMAASAAQAAEQVHSMHTSLCVNSKE